MLGPITRSVEDAAIMMDVMSNRAHQLDWQIEPSENSNFAVDFEAGIRGLRVAYSPNLGLADVDPGIARCVAAAVQMLRDLGAQIEPVAVPQLQNYVESRMHSVQWIANLHSTVSRVDSDKRDLIDSDTLALARLGEDLPSWMYHAALSAREQLGQAMHLFFSDHDLLVCPTFHVGPPATPGVPPHLREAPRFTSWVNQTMQPAASIPCGFDDEGLPVGLQIVGRRFSDALVLRASRTYEKARGPFPMPAFP
ncbi:MAG: Amidase [Bradyrhizobium sp.]|nr:Amidase [Bradyrhizobium sp.]MEA2869921.1 aspartyl-tRNA(Asn)/glutamyl-tRNA(Gln) amidotransferase subunit [Bradyrhizobium sp.]